MIRLSTISFFIFIWTLSACTHRSTGYINPNKLIEGYHGATAKRQAFLSQAKVWQANLDSLTAEMSVQPPAQAKDKEQQFAQYRQAIQQKAQAEEARVNQEILADINAYIKQYGKEHDYDFIFGATDQGNIVYAAQGTELTEAILAGLNKQYDQRRATQGR